MGAGADLQTFSFDLHTQGATEALAHRLGPALKAGDCLLLDGPIGAGKTTFARALIQGALGRLEDVPSPTFTLVQSYTGPSFDIWHCDLYRLTGADELVELGLDDAFETALTLIEWPDRLGALAPDRAQHLRFEVDGESEARRLIVHGDARWAALREGAA
ncbi:MAG: tRNA (adenosine(37)-N6)-threonylcarbamoyltransferase complex ATPase subunit type 1 TsaE [Pseudomonadota bacterium]